MDTQTRWTPASTRRATLVGVGRSLGAVAATLAFGLGWAAVEHALGGGPPPVAPRPTSYDRAPMEEAPPPAPPSPAEPEPELWLVDGFNVLHAGVLKGRDRAGWWKASVQLRLVERVALFEPADAELWVVFDAASPGSERCAPGEALARVHLVFAPSADDWLVRRVRQDEAPERLAVVSGDRQVTGRARHAGARIVSPRSFLARCPVAGTEPTSS